MTAGPGTLEDRDLELALADPVQRHLNSRALVLGYYERVTDSYRATWGDSFHFGVFSGNETRETAIEAAELDLCRAAGLGPGMRALDVGCGVGGPALTIAAASGARVTGVDLVPRHVAIARGRALRGGLRDQVDFVCADASDLPFADGTFDVVYVFESGCHMPDKTRFYGECARVLRPGGIFLGNDWMASGPEPEDGGAALLEAVCRYHALPDLIDPGRLRLELERAGLDVDFVDTAVDADQILRHWSALDVRPPAGSSAGPTDSAERLLTNGGWAIAEAARAGHFVVCRWRSHKPEPG